MAESRKPPYKMIFEDRVECHSRMLARTSHDAHLIDTKVSASVAVIADGWLDKLRHPRIGLLARIVAAHLTKVPRHYEPTS